ncbi:MAG: ABC transporter ATP-binding protein [Candidatus Competibacteraceae bacterium]|nr:ABC transporter ATP-binding protein [Candidatus Competibacteraceae bacterium]
MTEFLLELDDVACRYHSRQVVQHFSFRVRKGGLVCLLGPSGCGKTTVLRAIAGFVPVHDGTVRLRGKAVSTSGFSMPSERRRLGMVFQDYALFPHLNVLDNVIFGLRGAAGARRETGRNMLDLVGLAEQCKRYPHELSGGQQQRVALARALAPQPDLILLDEPFSSLDVDLRERLAYEVHDILKAQGITGVLVTHDQHEAFAMAEQVGVMQDGQLLQWDTPYNLYHEPANRFVADFIGQGRFLEATLLTPDTLETELGLIHGNRAFLWPSGTRLEILLRPDDVVPDQHGPLQATVTKKAFKGAETLYTLQLNGTTELLSLFPSHLDYRLGDQVGIRIDVAHLVAFAKP